MQSQPLFCARCRSYHIAARSRALTHRRQVRGARAVTLALERDGPHSAEVGHFGVAVGVQQHIRCLEIAAYEWEGVCVKEGWGEECAMCIVCGGS